MSDLKAEILKGTPPSQARVRSLNLSGVKEEFSLPGELECFTLTLANSSVNRIPERLKVEFRLDLTGCVNVTALPRGLKAGSLILNGCSNLEALPEDLTANFLNLEGCSKLVNWPDSAEVSMGSVTARGCAKLGALPSTLGPLTNLDLNGCSRIHSLPAGLKLSGWLDIAGTGITSLPESLTGVQLRWRGVNITAQIAFFPETLTAADILQEQNAEIRRVMLERFGLERFTAEANAKILDEDTDPGGRRRLLKVPLKDDEDLVCVSVNCPSTGRHYLIRVPPTTRTCRQAIAWTAGFDDPDDYDPIAET